MKIKAYLFWLICLAGVTFASLEAAPAQLISASWHSASPPRLTLEFSERPQVRVASNNPGHLLIELDGSAAPGRLSQPPNAHPIAGRISTAPGKHAGSTRLKIDLKRYAKPEVHFESHRVGARLVVAWPETPAKPRSDANESGSGKRAHGNPSNKPLVIAIDAGHGGKDTGAIGPGGTLEKDVVLSIARRLADYISAEPGMKAVMVRRGDHFVDLRQRASLARRTNADLFVSLHADAYVNNEAHGSSVFILSDRGASSEAARWLADTENAALAGGVHLKDKSRGVASVLLQLSTNATLEASERAAGRVLRELRKDFDIHHDEVQKAGFVVLKSPDIPSILVETAFISNPDEERKLRNPKHQAQIARSIFQGVKAYFAGQRAPQPSSVTVADAAESVVPGKRSGGASASRH